MPLTNWKYMALDGFAIPSADSVSRFDERTRQESGRLISTIHESRVLEALRDIALLELMSDEVGTTRAVTRGSTQHLNAP